MSRPLIGIARLQSAALLPLAFAIRSVQVASVPSDPSVLTPPALSDDRLEAEDWEDMDAV